MVSYLLQIWQTRPDIPVAYAIEVEKSLEELEEEEVIEINATFVRRCVRIGKEIKKLRQTAKRLSVHVVIEDGRQFHCRHTQILFNKAIKRERALPKHIYYGQD